METDRDIFFLCVTADAANKIICSKDHLSTLVRCCDSSGHEGVKAEASRMLAMMAKQARTAGELGLGFGPQLFPRDKTRISVLPHTGQFFEQVIKIPIRL